MIARSVCNEICKSSNCNFVCRSKLSFSSDCLKKLMDNLTLVMVTGQLVTQPLPVDELYITFLNVNFTTPLKPSLQNAVAVISIRTNNWISPHDSRRSARINCYETSNICHSRFTGLTRSNHSAHKMNLMARVILFQDFRNPIITVYFYISIADSLDRCCLCSYRCCRLSTLSWRFYCTWSCRPKELWAL